MAINNTKVLFQYGSGSAAAAAVAGALTFDATAKAIYVGDGSVANLVTSAVKDATFTNRVLTVSKVDGTSFTLDFSDVASAEGVNSLLATLRDDINALDASISTLKGRVDNHDTSLANLNTSITNLDASYKAADASLKSDLIGDAAEAYNTLGKLEDKIQAEANTRSTEDASVLQAAKDYADTKGAAATTKVVEGTDAGDNMTIESSIGENGATTYTINLTNVASASAFAAHDGSADIHVTKAQKEAWQDATDAINAFITSDSAQNTALDTLKEIQDFLSADDGAVKALTAKVADNEDAIEILNGDASTAGSVAKAVADVVGDAAEAYNTLGKLEDKILAEASARIDADEALEAKITAITNGTNAVISFGGAKGAIAIDTADGSNGDVKFAMDGSTLTGHVEGLGSAAFTDSSAYATAAQGAKADSAVQKVVEGETNGTIKVDGTAVAVYGLGSAAYTDSTAYDASGSAAAAQTAAINAVTGTAADASDAKTIEGTRKYAKALVDAVPAATVTAVDPNAVADASNYVSIALKLDGTTVKVDSVSVDTQAVASASADAKGLAEASDVKSYVDTTVNTALAWKVL